MRSNTEVVVAREEKRTSVGGSWTVGKAYSAAGKCCGSQSIGLAKC